MRCLASLIPLLAVGALGCVEPASDDSGDRVAATEQALSACDTWICGSNSPVISSLHFHELNTRGLPNAEGFSVMALFKAGIDYQLSVERGKIIGRMGSLQIQGTALQGAEIRLRLETHVFAVRITAVGSVPTFARLSGSQRLLETYQLDVGEIIGGASPTGWRNLCSNPPARDNPDVQGMNTYHSLVFEGERIDPLRKTISTVLDTSWFNIGCAGHAIAKMAVNAETEAARLAFGFATSIADRQTFLKMITADYCGTGKPFTVSGQPLQWMDWHGYTQYVSSPANLALEARWSPSGAVCLNTPRVDANPTPLGQTIFMGNVLGEIAMECGALPACAGGVTSFGSERLLSANPI